MQQQVLPVGTTPVLVIEPGQDGVLLQADPANTADIYLGAQNVTGDSTTTGGIRLSPGSTARFVTGPSDYIWAVSSAASQNIRLLYPLSDAIVELYAQGVAGSAGGQGQANQYLYNPASGLYEQARTPTIVKLLAGVAVGSEATIWTPAAGKKFRLMGFQLAQGTATGAVILKDNTAGTSIYEIPQATVGVPISSPPLGNGILSAAANNVLTATGVATETLTGVVYGTEE